MNAYLDFIEDSKISRDDRFRQRYEICNSYLSATGTHLGERDSAIAVHIETASFRCARDGWPSESSPGIEPTN